MDVSITNGLEGVRQYFQRLPATSNSSENLVNTHHPPPIISNYSTEPTKSWQGSNNNLTTTTTTTITQNEKSELSSSSSHQQTTSLNSSSTFLESTVTDTNSSQTESTSSNSTHLNSYHQSFAENSSKDHEQNESTNSSVSLPKHEMRPHNHDIWKVSHEQRLPNIDDLSKNVNENKQNEICQNLTTTESISSGNSSNNKILPNEPIVSKSETADKIDNCSTDSKSVSFSQYQQHNSTQPVQNFDTLPQASSESKVDMKLYNDSHNSSKSLFQSSTDVSSAPTLSTCDSVKSASDETPKSLNDKDETTQSSSESNQIKSSENQTLSIHSQREETTVTKPTPVSEDVRLSFDNKSITLTNLEPTDKSSRPEQIRPPSHGDETKPFSYGEQIRPPSHGEQIRPPSHGELVKFSSNTDLTRPPSNSGHIRLSFHEEQIKATTIRPPSHGDQVRPLSHEDQMRPPSHGDQMRPPSHGSLMRPPSHGDLTRPPSHGDPMRPPSHGDPMRPPSHGDLIRPPSHGDQSRPPSHGEQMRPPSHGEQMRPPSHGEQMRPPSHGDQMRPPSLGDQMRPPSLGDQMRPPSLGDQMRPPSLGSQSRPPSHGDPTRPPSHGDLTRPPSHGDLTRPPSHGDPMRPPSHGDSMRPPSQGDPTRPSSHGESVRPPSHENQMRPPSHSNPIRPPSHGDQIRPPSGEHMKLSYQADQLMKPLSNEQMKSHIYGNPIRPPSNGEQIRPMLYGEQIRPPSLGEQIRLYGEHTRSPYGEQIKPSMYGDHIRPPTHGDYTRQSSQSEQLRSPFQGEQMRPPSYGEQMRPPSHGEQIRPPSHGEQMRPPSHGEQMRPPSHGEQIRPPSHGGLIRPPSHGEQIKPSQYKEQIKSPSNGDQMRSHMYGEQFKTLHYNEQIRSSTQNEHFKSPSHGEYFRLPSHGEQVRPSVQNEPVRMPHYTEPVKSYYGEHVRLPTSSEQIRPPSRGELMRPHNYMEQVRPSSHGDPTKQITQTPRTDIVRPPLHDELTRASLHKDQAKIPTPTSFAESKHPFHYSQARSSFNGEQIQPLTQEDQTKLYHKDQIKSLSQCDQSKYTSQPGQVKTSPYQLHYQYSVSQTKDIPTNELKMPFDIKSASHQIKQHMYQETKPTYDKKLLAHDLNVPQHIRSIELRPSSYDMNSVSLDNKPSNDIKPVKQDTKISQDYKNYTSHMKPQEFRSDIQSSVQNIPKMYATSSKIPHSNSDSQLPSNDIRHHPYLYRTNSLNDTKTSNDSIKPVSTDLKFHYQNDIKYANQNLKKSYYDPTTSTTSIASLYHSSKYDNIPANHEKNRRQSINDVQNYSMNYSVSEINKPSTDESKTVGGDSQNKPIERAPSVEIIETFPPASKSSVQDLRASVENIPRPDRNYALYPPNKQIIKQEKLNNAQATSYQTIKSARSDVSLPYHDIQASFNDIQTIDKMKNLNRSVPEPTNQSFQTAHATTVRYDIKNNAPSNDKNIENKLKEQYSPYSNLNQRVTYPTNTPYNQGTQPHYNHIPTTTSASVTTNHQVYYPSHDKRLSNSHLPVSQAQEYQQMLTKSSQNSTEKNIPYSRSYSYAPTSQIPSSQPYNPQEQQHYPTKTNTQPQESQHLEKQRLPYNQYQVSSNPPNSSSYNPNYQPRIEIPNKTSISQSYRSQPVVSQTQQNYQNNPNYTPVSRSYYPPITNVQTSQHDTPPSSQMSQYMPYPSTTNAGQYPPQQYLPNKSSQYQQYSSGSNTNPSQTQSYQKATHTLPTTNLTPASYMAQKSGKELPHKSTSRQKQTSQSVSSYNNTPHLAFKTTNSVPSKSAYKYPTHISSTTMNQYYPNNGQNYSYINTTAHMSNYTNTTSVVNSVQASTVSTNSSMQPYQQYAKSGLPQDSYKRQAPQTVPPQVQSKPVSLQTHPNMPTKVSAVESHNASTKIDGVSSSKVRRDSPLDLSVKTVRTSADSTADDDVQIIEHRPSHQNILSHPSQASQPLNMNQYAITNQRPSLSRNPTAASAPRFDFSPNFSSPQLTQPQLRFSVPNQQKVYSQSNTPAEPTPYSGKQISTPEYSQANIVNKKFDNRTAYYQNYHSQRYAANVLPQNSTRPVDPASINNPTNSLPKVEFPPSNPTHKMVPNNYPQTNLKDINRKRPSEMDPLSSPAKIPRVDSWRQSIDQQIEQRFLSYTNSRLQEEKQKEQQQPPITPNIVKPQPPLINGHTVPNTYQVPSHEEPNPYQRTHPQSTPEMAHYPQPYSNTTMSSYPQPQNIPQTHPVQYHPQSEPSGISSPSMSYNKSPQKPGTPNQNIPSNTGADKRVLDILRNSIMNNVKEAQKKFDIDPAVKPMDITPVHPQQPPEQHQPATDSATPVPAENKSFLPTTNTALEYPTIPNKFHIPRSTELPKFETSVPKESKPPLIPPQSTNESIVLDNSNPPSTQSSTTSATADLDGLAANLAARIRTKAELKQLHSTQFNKINSEHTEADVSTSANTDETEKSIINTSTTVVSNPPKLTKEKVPVLPPRRRLFSRNDEDGNSSIPHRNSTLRSSSETSVFDFRDSDSEGEMPVLERQSLDDLRRDRKSLSKPPSTTNLAADLEVVVKNEPTESPDPFFSEACDKFLEQLRTGGSSSKKRGRKKKIVEPEIIAKLENTMKNHQQLMEVEIKVEKCDDIIIKTEKIEPPPTNDVEIIEEKIESTVIKDDDSDSDVPLIRKRNNTPNNKKIESDSEDDDDICLAKKRREKIGAKIKLQSSTESSDSENENTDNKETETVAHRLKQRKCRSSEKRSDSENSMNLRNREITPQKNRSKSLPQKKPFGDGSDFRPGWEEEVYRYKQSLRMPAQLINISRPSRLSTSLPDLDPCPSPTASSITDNEFFSQKPSFMKNLFGSSKIKREFDSDLDSNSSFSLMVNKNVDDSEDATCSSILSSASKITSNQKENSSSIVDVLAQRYGKHKRRKAKKTDNGPKIIPKSSNTLELLPTPTPDNTVKDDTKDSKKGKKTKNKSNDSEKSFINNNSTSSLLESFRKKTINNFRNAFGKNSLNEQFTPIIFKSRTRKETQILKKRATIREVFGEERPASAPPMTNHQELPKETTPAPKKKKTVNTKLSSKSKKDNMPGRAGLRSALVLRGNRSVHRTKHQIMKPNKKRLMKSLAAKKKLKAEAKEKKLLNLNKDIKKNVKDSTKEQKPSKTKTDIKSENKIVKSETNKTEDKIEIKQEIKQEKEGDDDASSELSSLPVKRKYKLKSMRRKFSSGFDYIRKKKKQVKKENAETETKPRKRGIVQRASAESVQDIAREIKGWVLNKGIGETHLHRAARLGYTDVIAYCLETLNSPPSPRDNAGYTPLHEACSRGHLDIAKLLLLYGANVHESAQGGIRPLHEASENGFVEIIRLLLSYGADPLLATYSGYTPLSLATDPDAIDVLQNYLADVQGKDAPLWNFPGPASCFHTKEEGYDALEGAPDPDPKNNNIEIEFEICDMSLPNLYTLTSEDPSDKWVLLQDLTNLLKVKSKEALLRQLNTTTNSTPQSKQNGVIKEMKMADFLDQAHCCSLLSAGERINIRASKIALVKYTDRVKELLGVENFLLSPSKS